MKNELPIWARDLDAEEQAETGKSEQTAKPAAAKPEIKSESAAPTVKHAISAKPETNKKKSATAHAPDIKSSPVNPTWALEVAKAYGLAGNLADAVADQLVAAVTDHLGKITSPEKLTKLVREAAAECIGNFGPQ